MIVKNIDVSKVVVDMPVSEPNVAQKVESLRANGIIQPITVWKHNGALRVIDGFHRVEAAKRLGWTHVAATVVECTEEAFWDARIQSARQHADISEKRLMEWVTECWQQSKAGKTKDEALADLAETLWNADLKRFGYGSRYAPGRKWNADRKEFVDDSKTELTPTQNAVYTWISDKAERWGIEWGDLVRMILGRFISVNTQPGSDVDEAARRMGYDFKQRQEIDALSNISHDPKEVDFPARIVEYVESDGEIDAGVFVKRYNDERRALWVESGKEELNKIRQEVAAQETARQRHEEWIHNTEDGRKHASQECRRRVDVLISHITALHTEQEWALRQMADGPALVATMAQVVGDFITRVWPSTDAEYWHVPELLQQNIELRRLLAKEHTARIQAEAQLLSGIERSEKLRERLPDVMAWPASNAA